MDCKEMFARLSEFLDGELTQELCEEIQAHLEGCRPCEAFARALRRTVELCRQLPSKPLPEQLRQELRVLVESERR